MKKLIAILSTLLIIVNLGFAQGVVSRPTKKTQKTVKTTGQKNTNRKKSSSESKGPTPLTKKNTNPSTPSQPDPKKKQTSGHFINGHEWVDLGLPSGLKWATCNIGASTPEAYGKYYAWGEINTKYSYTPDNSRTYGKASATLRTEGIINYKGQLNKSYDAASANWGSTWRMPTKEEFEELSNKCKWEWIEKNRTEGYKVTGPNNNSIFLPAAGYRTQYKLWNDRSAGNYWSSSNKTEYLACIMRFSRHKNEKNNYEYLTYLYHSVGCSVRPVTE